MAIKAAIATAPAPIGTEVDTIYFGGGTPYMLGTGLADILTALQNHFTVLPHSEITLEANPGEIELSVLTALAEAGFNRISFGLQSSNEAEQKLLGRKHNTRQVAEAVSMAREAGFHNISLDLMLGLPNQSPETVAESIDFCAAQNVEHISAYILKIEPSTVFARRYSDDDIDPDLQADIYLDAVRRLEEHGYAQYEISNFAKHGFEGRHNLHYWQCEEYLGIGTAASSYLGGQRFVFPRNLTMFLQSQNPWSLVVPEGDGGGFEEYVMLGLRLNKGLDTAAAAALFPDKGGELLQKAKDKIPVDFLHIEGDVISLTPQGMLMSNAIIASLLY